MGRPSVNAERQHEDAARTAFEASITDAQPHGDGALWAEYQKRFAITQLDDFYSYHFQRDPSCRRHLQLRVAFGMSYRVTEDDFPRYPFHTNDEAKP